MVAPTPKTPRHQLTEQEQRLCREALLSLRHERRIRRAQQKDGGDGDATGKNKKASRKKSAKHTTPAMERGHSCTSTQYQLVPTSSGRQAVRGVVQRTASSERSRKRRRRVLQASDGEASVAEDDGEVALPLPQIPLACVVNGDANLMPAGAEQCTGLNSDEDPSLPQDCEDEEGDDDDDDWVEDWDIGHLSDEDSDEAAVDLPDSVCLTAARNKKAMSIQRSLAQIPRMLACTMDLSAQVTA
ncbi:hypothetical protein PF001_g26113 [Phytophthora fragariae]|uniref:Uncharacterized protein n=1 Tax=Phytophthora fragariae TaxID=53985 RepID=A0A6A4BKL3_9STRA|nr:hypothetical protein PF001_g26113 [Phytophthora fragariae]